MRFKQACRLRLALQELSRYKFVEILPGMQEVIVRSTNLRIDKHTLWSAL